MNANKLTVEINALKVEFYLVEQIQRNGKLDKQVYVMCVKKNR